MTGKRHVCMISIHSSPLGKIGTRDTGGMSVYLRETAQYIANKNGWCVDLVTLAGRGQQTTISSLAPNLRLICLSSPSVGSVNKDNLVEYLPEICCALVQLVREQRIQYSVVHSHYWLSGLLAEMFRNHYSVLHVTTFHTLGAVKNRACRNNQESQVRIESESRIVKECNRIISFTQDEKSDLSSLYYAEDEKVSVVPCGVDGGLFRPAAKEEARHLLAINNNCKVLLFVGRFVTIKGIDHLLSAMTMLQDSDLVLYLVGGDGHHTAAHRRVAEKVSRLNLAESVKLIGRVEHGQLPVYYSAADAVAVPSLHESFGLVALEALSCGTPVIGSHVGGMPDLIRTGTGVTVPPGDACALAQAIEQLLINRSITQLPWQLVRQSIASYSWQRTADNLMTIYESLLEP